MVAAALPQNAAMQTLHQTRHALATLDDAGIGTLQLTDAGALNIVGSAAIGDLRQALAALSATPALRVLVLRGSGERAFIGGADIAEMAMLNPASAIRAKVPISDTGMVNSGITDARRVRRNTKITSATSTTASAIVW